MATATESKKKTTKKASTETGGSAEKASTETNGSTEKASTETDGATKKSSGKMSDEHRESLARGRRESAAVRRYLEAVQDVGPQIKDPEDIKSQISQAQQAEDNATSAMERLEAIQRRMDLERQLAVTEESGNFEELESAFVEVASSWAQRKGFSYPAFRELGVPAAVLKQAGIARTNRRRS